MQDKILYFVSKNKFKHAEASEILGPTGVTVLPHHLKINELQTADTNQLVKDKAVQAFKQLGRPLFVEHTGLFLEILNGLPGGLTQLVWDSLDKERFAELFSSEQGAIAKTTIGYVDGKQIHFFTGEIKGKIVSPPRIDHGFQWDCVFLPDGFNETFSEMGPLKNQISMRRLALEQLKEHLEAPNENSNR